MAATNAVEGSSYNLPQKGTRVPKKELNQDDFLSLLVSQLKNQDPLEPQSNEEFISTMAQFNSLETMDSINKSIQYSQAMEMHDRSVTVKELNRDPITGKVEKVGVIDGKVMVYLNGNKYSISDVKEISLQEPGGSSLTGIDIFQAALMIGKRVLLQSDGQVRGTVEKVGVIEGKLKVYVNGKPYDPLNITEIENAEAEESVAADSQQPGQNDPAGPEVTEGEG